MSFVSFPKQLVLIQNLIDQVPPEKITQGMHQCCVDVAIHLNALKYDFRSLGNSHPDLKNALWTTLDEVWKKFSKHIDNNATDEKAIAQDFYEFKSAVKEVSAQCAKLIDYIYRPFAQATGIINSADQVTTLDYSIIQAQIERAVESAQKNFQKGRLEAAFIDLIPVPNNEEKKIKLLSELGEAFFQQNNLHRTLSCHRFLLAAQGNLANSFISVLKSKIHEAVANNPQLQMQAFRHMKSGAYPDEEELFKLMSNNFLTIDEYEKAYHVICTRLEVNLAKGIPVKDKDIKSLFLKNYWNFEKILIKILETDDFERAVKMVAYVRKFKIDLSYTIISSVIKKQSYTCCGHTFMSDQELRNFVNKKIENCEVNERNIFADQLLNDIDSDEEGNKFQHPQKDEGIEEIVNPKFNGFPFPA